MLRGLFGFSERQQKATYGLGFTLTLLKNSVLNKANATIVGKIKIVSIECYVPHYTASSSQQAIISEQVFSKVPTELQYAERVFL